MTLKLCNDGVWREAVPKRRYRKVGRGSRYKWNYIKGVSAHVAVAEKVLGRKLRGSECVHHVDGNGLNNANSNLVICPNQAYHKMLHVRERALDACGNTDYRMCTFCKGWSDPSGMKELTRCYAHYSCVATYKRELYRRNSGK